MLQKKPQQTQRGQLVWARMSSVVINSEDVGVVIATCCILSCLIALLPVSPSVSPFPDILMERTPKVCPMKHAHAREQHREHTADTHTQYTRHTDTRARHRARVFATPCIFYILTPDLNVDHFTSHTLLPFNDKLMCLIQLHLPQNPEKTGHKYLLNNRPSQSSAKSKKGREIIQENSFFL